MEVGTECDGSRTSTVWKRIEEGDYADALLADSDKVTGKQLHRAFMKLPDCLCGELEDTIVNDSKDYEKLQAENERLRDLIRDYANCAECKHGYGDETQICRECDYNFSNWQLKAKGDGEPT